jgi:two-component system sensor kinase FixL
MHTPAVERTDRALAGAPALPWPHHARVRTGLRWIGLSIAGCLLLAAWRYVQLDQEFAVDARARYSMIAQRMDQHDAHLTSLAAVAQLDDSGYASFNAVAAAVRKYYPRIAAIQLIGLDPAPRVLASTEGEADLPVAMDTVRQRAQSLSAGRAAVLANGDGKHYVLVKRLGGESLTALVMVIDSARLADTETADGAPLDLLLSDAEGVVVGRVPAAASAQTGRWLPTLRAVHTLASASQPLQLSLQRHVSLNQLLPAPLLLLVLSCSAALLWLVDALRRTRLARQEAALRGQELRLAHAMRVNGLGEMASGIAHELTQPMTAVLSQSQAGMRLIENGAGTEELVPVLQANIRLARRAGDILSRMRSYASQRPPATTRTMLDTLVIGAVELARADIAQRGIVLSTELGAADASVQVDPVSIEQVLHNLLRNAAESLDTAVQGAAHIAVITAADAEGVHVSVRDNGPGIGPQDLNRLFTPFFTTKAGGMGLGLSICERLVEAAGGHIEVVSAPGGGACFTVHLPRAPEISPA